MNIASDGDLNINTLNEENIPGIVPVPALHRLIDVQFTRRADALICLAGAMPMMQSPGF